MKKTVFLPDGYNGHLEEYLTEPVAIDGDLVKLRTAHTAHLQKWVRISELKENGVDTNFRFRVWYLTHKYIDCSDTPRLSSRIVKAESRDEAREIVRKMEKAGSRYIGMIHTAELIIEE